MRGANRSQNDPPGAHHPCGSEPPKKPGASNPQGLTKLAPESCSRSQPNHGFWKMAGVTYRDEIVIYRVLATDVGSARSFLSVLKERLKHELRQEELLIIERDVAML